MKNDLFTMREKMGMVFQQFNLFPNMTVMENITLSPIKTKGESKEVAKKRAQELLEKVGLPDKATTIHRVVRWSATTDCYRTWTGNGARCFAL